MKNFKPAMKDGMGNAKDMSPEAHNEWADKEGKHSSIPIQGEGVQPAKTNEVVGKRSDALTPQEKENMQDPTEYKGRMRKPFPSKPSGGPVTGTKRGQGAGK